MGIAKIKLAIQTTAITENDNSLLGLLRRGYMIARYLERNKLHLLMNTLLRLSFSLIRFCNIIYFPRRYRSFLWLINSLTNLLLTLHNQNYSFIFWNCVKHELITLCSLTVHDLYSMHKLMKERRRKSMNHVAKITSYLWTC